MVNYPRNVVRWTDHQNVIKKGVEISKKQTKVNKFTKKIKEVGGILVAVVVFLGRWGYLWIFIIRWETF